MEYDERDFMDTGLGVSAPAAGMACDPLMLPPGQRARRHHPPQRPHSGNAEEEEDAIVDDSDDDFEAARPTPRRAQPVRAVSTTPAAARRTARLQVKPTPLGNSNRGSSSGGTQTAGTWRSPLEQLLTPPGGVQQSTAAMQQPECTGWVTHAGAAGAQRLAPPHEQRCAAATAQEMQCTQPQQLQQRHTEQEQEPPPQQQQQAQPWWWGILEDFVPVEVLVERLINPRDGSVVYINYTNQFKQEGSEAPGGDAAGGTRGRGARKSRGRAATSAKAFVLAAAGVRTGGRGGKTAGRRKSGGSKAKSSSKRRRGSMGGSSGAGQSSTGAAEPGGKWRWRGGKKIFISAEGRQLTGAAAFKAYKAACPGGGS